MKKAILLSLLLVAPLASAPKPAVTGDLSLVVMTQSSSYGGYSSTSRSLSANYSSTVRAPQGANGTMTVPAGLGLGPVIPLNITNVEGTDVSASAKVIHYWGCSETIQKGQPEVINTQHKGTGKTVKGGSGGIADPMKLTPVPETAQVAGNYAFKISYLGDVNVPMTEKQQFLAPLTITEPANPAEVNTSGAVKISWNPVPNALGYSVMAAGKNAKGETVYWESHKDATTSWYTMGVAAAVKAGKLHGPEHKTCTIPAGIFTGMVGLTVSGYSQEAKGSGVLTAWGWAQTNAGTSLGKP